MKILSLDLEMSDPQGLCRIIQVGYVIGDTKTGEILRKRSLLIKLPKGEKLQSEISELCGIAPHEVEQDDNNIVNCINAMTLVEAYDILVADVKELKPFMNPLTWGGGDSELLKEKLTEEGVKFIWGNGETVGNFKMLFVPIPVSEISEINEADYHMVYNRRWIMGRRWIDAKTLFVSRSIIREETISRSGLEQSMKRLEMEFEGRPHQAMDDALNTFRIYLKLLEYFKDPMQGGPYCAQGGSDGGDPYSC